MSWMAEPSHCCYLKARNVLEKSVFNLCVYEWLEIVLKKTMIHLAYDFWYGYVCVCLCDYEYECECNVCSLQKSIINGPLFFKRNIYTIEILGFWGSTFKFVEHPKSVSPSISTVNSLLLAKESTVKTKHFYIDV